MQTQTELVLANQTPLEVAGLLANGYAAQGAFSDYQSRLATNTIERQRFDLSLFASFLATAGIPGSPSGAALYSEPSAWKGLTWGLVEGFRNWMLQAGYAVGSVNGRLSTIKVYCGLAAKAGALDRAELAMIRLVEGYSHKQGKHVNEKREVSRVGAKKAEAIYLTPQQIKRLKKQPNTPQGRRDAVIICLLVDHGLRVGELVGLLVTHVNLEAGTLTFYRPKVNKTQTHELTPDSKRALGAYFSHGDALASGPLLRASTTTGGVRLSHAGMSARSITARVCYLGEYIAVYGLSAHDLRHTFATQLLLSKTPLDQIRVLGGWKNFEWMNVYLDHSNPEIASILNPEIANHGVILE